MAGLATEWSECWILITWMILNAWYISETFWNWDQRLLIQSKTPVQPVLAKTRCRSDAKTRCANLQPRNKLLASILAALGFPCAAFGFPGLPGWWANTQESVGLGGWDMVGCDLSHKLIWHFQCGISQAMTVTIGFFQTISPGFPHHRSRRTCAWDSVKVVFPKSQWTPVFLWILGFTGQLMDDDGWIMAVSEIHKKCSLSIVSVPEGPNTCYWSPKHTPENTQKIQLEFLGMSNNPMISHHNPIKNPPFFLVK